MNAVAEDFGARPLVLQSRDGAIATLTLNRPRHYNLLSIEMLDALHAAQRELAADTAIHVVVLAGAGKAFCAGHDLKQMRAHVDKAYQTALFDKCSDVMLGFAAMPQPVIARVHGIATAAGCQLVAACDLAVASSDARFATSGINVGLFCSTPAVALARNIGRKAAMEMLVTGDFIDAQTALARGLVNRVAPPGELDAAVRALADRICEKSRAAIAIGKAAFYRQLDLGIGDAYRCATDAMACGMLAEDAAEGIDAFIGKRRPVWHNR